jgi:hypothetical protein
MKLRLALLAVAIAVTSVTAVSSVSAAGAKLTSSLDGKSALPHAIRWVATPPKPYKKVAKVEFLIDGKLRWVEKNAPYVYGGDGDKLVTTWLAPGEHTFSVRAVRRGGSTLTRTTKATVQQAPPPPQELALMTFTRKIQEQGKQGAPAGTWKLYVSAAGWQISDPLGYTNFIDAVYGAGQLVTLGYGIWTKPHSGHEGNGFCEDSNNPVSYHWSVAGSKLSLELSGADHCGEQSFVVAGDWTHS